MRCCVVTYTQNKSGAETNDTPAKDEQSGVGAGGWGVVVRDKARTVSSLLCAHAAWTQWGGRTGWQGLDCAKHTQKSNISHEYGNKVVLYILSSLCHLIHLVALLLLFYVMLEL